MTIKEYIDYVDIYPYTKECFNMQKDIMQLQLMNLELECFKYKADNKFSLNQLNHLLVESNDNSYQTIEHLYTEKSNAIIEKIKKILNMLWDAIKSFAKKIKIKFDQVLDVGSEFSTKGNIEDISEESIKKIEEAFIKALEEYKDVEDKYILQPNIHREVKSIDDYYIKNALRILKSKTKFKVDAQVDSFVKTMIIMTTYWDQSDNITPYEHLMGPKLCKSYYSIITDLQNMTGVKSLSDEERIQQQILIHAFYLGFDPYIKRLKDDCNEIIQYKFKEIDGVKDKSNMMKVCNDIGDLINQLNIALDAAKNPQDISKINELSSALLKASNTYMKAISGFYRLMSLSMTLNREIYTAIK